MNDSSTVNNERRIKKHIFSQRHALEAIAQPGFQNTSLAECQRLIGPHRTQIDRTHLRMEEVAFDEILKLVYLAKTIDDVWFEAARFRFKGLVGLAAQLEQSLVPLAFVSGVSSFEFKIEIIKSHFQDKKALQVALEKYFHSVYPAEASAKPLIVQIRLFRDVLHLLIPLAGAPLYKRGYRGLTTSTDAPLRETIASSAIQFFFQKFHSLPPTDLLLVPFGGSGTFLFEYWLYQLNLTNHAGRTLQLENLAFFPRAKCAHLVKKTLENAKASPLRTIYCDTAAKAQLACAENLVRFAELWPPTKPFVDLTTLLHDDFLQLKMQPLLSAGIKHIFIPLNPPYGLRLKKQSVNAFYKKISEKLEVLHAEFPLMTISGFVFCPTENAWQNAKNSLPSFQTTTCHFMQGGLDVRLMTFTTVFT